MDTDASLKNLFTENSSNKGELLESGSALVGDNLTPSGGQPSNFFRSLITFLAIAAAVGATFYGTLKGLEFFFVKKETTKQNVTDKQEVVPTPLPSPTPAPMVSVLETPTGYLNVRAAPSVSAEIITTVDPGENFVQLETKEDEAGDEWVKIKVDKETQGWVFGEYIEAAEEEE